ncbi:MAG TPA: sugar transferase [Candidatus Eisenbergiella merdipullorum]|uniref:Sugar transferase n=1 Tax=Candidatus Eisenbergiella merdipullorum TaxID=2838553 RepID=A0A9D2I8J8_9FIRM|nr:sugar transferase [Candidatus Eisenbergiella merdipullorum]
MNDRDTRKRLVILLISLLGIAVIIGLYAWVWFDFYHPFFLRWEDIKLYRRGHILILGIYTVIYLLFSNLYGGLRIGFMKPMEVFMSQLFSLLCANVITYFQLALIHGNLIPALPLVEMMGMQLVWSAVWIFLANLVYRRIFPPRKLLLIHGDRSIDDILHKFESRKDKYVIAKCMGLGEGSEALFDEMEKGYGGVVLWDIPTAVRNKLLKYCYSRSIRIYLMPKIPDVIIKGSEQLHLFDTPILLTRENALTVEQRIIKRCIDIVCSLLLLVIASPFMLVTAIAIKLYDGGPVLYKQIRCTRGGKEFGILKFRSMRVDAEKDGVARLAAKHDSRITPIGRFIRAVRIDELPQLINILKGEMSFIGPRPERPEIIAQYLKEMPEFAFRTKVKAGLAGYAQVYGKYNTTPYDKLKLDLTYIESYSVWLDIKLMFLTLKILFRPESTEGVDEKQITAMKHDAQEDNK